MRYTNGDIYNKSKYPQLMKLYCSSICGVEVYPECWESSPEIAAFMRENNYTEISQVQQHFTERHIEMIKSLGASPIIWQDPLDFGVDVRTDKHTSNKHQLN